MDSNHSHHCSVDYVMIIGHWLVSPRHSIMQRRQLGHSNNSTKIYSNINTDTHVMTAYHLSLQKVSLRGSLRVWASLTLLLPYTPDISCGGKNNNPQSAG